MDGLKEEFLFADRILARTLTGEEEAIALDYSVQAALQRNRVYSEDATELERAQFRTALKDELRREAEAYYGDGAFKSDTEHCIVIERISANLSYRYEAYLVGRRFRFGTAQKAFNLYLKYLWALGKIPTPPHCPIDSIVLRAIGLDDSWTKCDSSEEYMGWILKIRSQLSLANWEHLVWLRRHLTDAGL